MQIANSFNQKIIKLIFCKAGSVGKLVISRQAKLSKIFDAARVCLKTQSAGHFDKSQIAAM